MGIRFEWDDLKARRNFALHGVSFDEAATVFRDPLSLTIGDPIHSNDEERWVILGYSFRGRLLVVVHSERGKILRLISARPATGHERDAYEEQRP
ncbi:MAG TPA: BrnT family toxin [Dehalococcoidia bacterium]|nr:BrnT family toxin [Dehalococcoidia bacterium]